MRTPVRLVWLAIVAAVLLSPLPVTAWGFSLHRYIVGRAIDLLPDPMRPFYESHRAFVVEHAVDPDLWRTAGFVAEAPRHYLNLDAYGRDPFDALPREWPAAVERFGESRLTEHGLLPWRTVEFYDRLVAAFRQQRQAGGSRALSDITFLSAVIAHYVSDAHVPFHAVRNYDGQLTGQHGIHARFESELFRRYADDLTVRPAPSPAVTAPLDFMFEALLDSARLVRPILDADRRAVAGRTEYDAAYFDRFVADVQPILEQRVAASATAVAALLSGAWTAGGRPALPLDPPRFTRKVRRPPE